MSDLIEKVLNGKTGKEPLASYPWAELADDLIHWSKDKGTAYRAFAFDLLVSLAYMDTISNIQSLLTQYSELPKPYTMHLGFTNLCTPLYIESSSWCYQKAAKPQSGSIGKLTSEIILRFLKLQSPFLVEVLAIGGVEPADAVLVHRNDEIILCEVKASPLTAFPFLFTSPKDINTPLNKLTRTQIAELNSGLYMYCDQVIPLGKASGALWPFSTAIPFVTNTKNQETVEQYVNIWKSIKKAYQTKDRETKFYYLANASGHPPKIAKELFDWPNKESVSDSKTSAGMDRTDDIKKGVYQTLKLAIESNRQFPTRNIKTALVSNLPAYRHGQEYVQPFCDVLWAFESAFQKTNKENQRLCFDSDLKRPFDYIITLMESSKMNGDMI